MGLLTIIPAVVLTLLWVSPTSARTDCHYDMKDMLEGTLEIAREVETNRQGQGEPADCTLAGWKVPKDKQQYQIPQSGDHARQEK